MKGIDPYEEKAIRDVARTLAELAAIELRFTNDHQLPADWFQVNDAVKIDRDLESRLNDQLSTLYWFRPAVGPVLAWWGWGSL